MAKILRYIANYLYINSQETLDEAIKPQIPIKLASFVHIYYKFQLCNNDDHIKQNSYILHTTCLKLRSDTY